MSIRIAERVVDGDVKLLGVRFCQGQVVLVVLHTALRGVRDITPCAVG